MPFAAFFDMLGSTKAFASLPDDYDFEQHRDRDFSSIEKLLERPEGLNFHTYMNAREDFHEAMSWAAEDAHGSLLLHASFSDCAYIICSTASAICQASSSAMRSCFRSNVPVRGGIGYGNFGIGQTMHFARQGMLSTESAFYGSSVIRAYMAERCGLKGFRLFVHNSAAPQLLALHPNLTGYPELDFSSYEEGQQVPNPPCGVLIPLENEVGQEVGYEMSFLGYDNVESFYRSVEMIRLAFPPDATSVVHYEKTLSALDLMDILRPATPQNNSFVE
jgi:hypothetical protein